MTQETAIQQHLKTKGTITPLQALDLYGCFRLAARIHVLRGKGWNIETEMIDTGDKRYARYRLKGKGNE